MFIFHSWKIFASIEEDSIIDYKIALFVKSLLEIGYINQETYDVFMYNTEDETIIDFIKLRMDASLIKYIKEHSLEKEIIKKEYGYEISERFEKILSEQDDLIQFEIAKIIKN